MTALAYSIDALPATQPLRVALLIDRPGTLHFLERELRRLGLEVWVPRDQHELLTSLQDGSRWVDAVFVDLGHRGLNSLSLLRQLADEFPGVRRIAMADTCLSLLGRVAARFGRTSLVLEQPVDRGSLTQLVALLDELVLLGGAPRQI